MRRRRSGSSAWHSDGTKRPLACRYGCLAAVVFVFGASAFVAAARADVVVEQESLLGDDEMLAEDMDEGLIHITGDHVDAWIFGKSLEDARKHHELRVKLKLSEIDRNCHLSDDQRRKLLLAARGDLVKFFNGVERVRAQVEAAKDDQNRITQLKWQELWVELAPLRIQFHAGLTGKESLFHKAVRKTLDPQQLATYDKLEAERVGYRQQARIALAVANFERMLPLSDRQRLTLLKLLKENKTAANNQQLDALQVIQYLSTLRDPQLKAILDDVQGRRFALIVKQTAEDGGMGIQLQGGAILLDRVLEVQEVKEAP